MKKVVCSQLTVHGKIISRKLKSVNCKLLTVNNSGQVMILAIVFLVVVLILAASLFDKVASYIRFGSNSIIREQATNVAEAGVDYAVWYLNKNGVKPSQDPVTVGTTGTFIVSVDDTFPTIRKITSTGYIPNSINPRAKRTVKVDLMIDGQGGAFNYAAQVGEDGLTMANQSKVVGTVYSNGNITGSGSSEITGDAYAVGSISSPDPKIDGHPYPSASPQPLPNFDYSFWKGRALDLGGEETCSPTCTVDSGSSIGPRKYNGNLIIRTNNQILLNGPINVTGDLSLQLGNTVVKLNDSFGSNGTAIVVGGKVILTQGGNFAPTDANPKGYIIVASESTASDAVTISQSGATAVFYALNGGGQLSQTASVVSLVAKNLSLSQSATLTYDTGLAGANFTTGPGGSWVIKKGTYRFTSSP